MIALRCSGLPLLFACASSTFDPLLVDTRNDAADVGSAVHEAMRQVVLGLTPDLDGICARWSADRDDVGVLVHYGRVAWETLAPSFPDPETEVEVGITAEDFSLTGHVDLRSEPEPKEATTLDWKTGRVDGDYFHQMAGYAACLILRFGYVKVSATVVWLREQEVETYVFTRADVDAWILRLVSQLSRRGMFSVGTHCQFCPRSHSCPAVAAKARAAVALFRTSEWSTDAIAGTLESLPPADRVALYRQAKLVASLAESAKQAVRLNVIQNGGELDAGDGKVLKIVEEPGRRTCDTNKIWPLLEAHLSEDEKANVVEVSASKFEDAVKAKAPARGGAAAIRALREQMETAGAVVQLKVKKLVERRK